MQNPLNKVGVVAYKNILLNVFKLSFLLGRPQSHIVLIFLITKSEKKNSKQMKKGVDFEFYWNKRNISDLYSRHQYVFLFLVRKSALLQNYANGGWRGGGRRQHATSFCDQIFFISSFISDNCQTKGISSPFIFDQY